MKTVLKGQEIFSAHVPTLSAWRRTCLTTLCAIVIGHMAACQRTDDTSAVLLARPPIPHGFDTYSREERVGVGRDRHALAVLKGLMDGTVHTTVHWDSAVVIWWLAESGDTAYVPVFLEGSRAHDTTALFALSVYGLARCASSPAAARRLDELARFGSDKARETAIGYLAVVNHAAARRLLRPLLIPGLPEPLVRQAASALERPEVQPELARFPPLKSQ